MGQRRWIRRTLEASLSRGAAAGANAGQAVADAPAAAAPAPAEARAAAPEATIAAGCELEGRLALPGPLVVYGDFKGTIECHEDVLVAEGGSVQGPIRARSVEVRGSVVGDLDARREIVLRSGGRLHGEAAAPSLVVERGAWFEGRSRRIAPIAPRPAATAAPGPVLD